jgi:hypothetical protein
VTRYSKTQQLHGSSKIILRYLPRGTSQILGKYLVYTKPFADFVSRQTREEYIFLSR